MAQVDRHCSGGSKEDPDHILTKEEARAIVAPLYEALNEPLKKDVSALLRKPPIPAIVRVRL